MNDISFTSRIVPLTTSQFGSKLTGMAKRVCADFPWTMQESAIGKDVYTTSIYDCTGCLITDGEKAILMHLDPENSINRSLYYLREYLRNFFCLNRPDLQALLIGSKNTKNSQMIFNNFRTILEEAHIPTSVLKNSKTPVSVAYKALTDEIYVSNADISKGIIAKKSANEILKSAFEKVEISELDEIA